MLGKRLKGFQMFKTQVMSWEEFQDRKREGDGLCSICYEWSLGKADPDAEHVYCSNCDNRSLCGVNIARILNLIEVEKRKPEFIKLDPGH